MTMQTIQIYDSPMCCSTGVCGPEVDTALAQFAGLLEQAKTQGWTVSRYNLSQEPIAFLENEHVKKLLDEKGVDALPVILINESLKNAGAYPSPSQWQMWLEKCER